LVYLYYPGGWVTNMFTTNVNGIVTYPDSPDMADYMPPGSAMFGSIYPPFHATTATNANDTYGARAGLPDRTRNRELHFLAIHG
jgi:hypothetical protein